MPLTPNSIMRMIVSATTDGEQAVASGKGHLGGVVGECRNPNRHPPRPHLSSATRIPAADNRNHTCTLIHEEPGFRGSEGATGLWEAVAATGLRKAAREASSPVQVNSTARWEAAWAHEHPREGSDPRIAEHLLCRGRPTICQPKGSG
jgi:hypothetical protein